MSDNSRQRAGVGLWSGWNPGDGTAGDDWSGKMNANLDMLDFFARGSVKDRDLAAPPGSPAEGDAYIVAASPSGAWAGQAKNIARFIDGTWIFYTAREGFRLWVDDENILYAFDGTNWAPYASGTAPGSSATLELDARRWATGSVTVQASGKYLGISLGGVADTSEFLLFRFPNSFSAIINWKVLFTSSGDFGVGVDWQFSAYKITGDGQDLAAASWIDGAVTTINAPSAANILKIANLNAPAISPAAGELWMLKITRLGAGDANGFSANFVGIQLLHT